MKKSNKFEVIYFKSKDKNPSHNRLEFLSL